MSRCWFWQHEGLIGVAPTSVPDVSDFWTLTPDLDPDTSHLPEASATE